LDEIANAQARSNAEFGAEIDRSQNEFFTNQDIRRDQASAGEQRMTIGKQGEEERATVGAKGEQEYMGYGVSACATCDGFFFKNQHVYVVGGGDTAMEEANYLTRFASKVTIIHRREEFRASKIMLERAKKNEKIEFMLNTTIDEYLGDILESGAKKLHSLRILNTLNNETSVVPADGVFVAIGHKPNTDLFKNDLTMDETGYIQTIGKSSYTNIDGVFACGDAQDSVYRQAITAAGSGCMAAIDAERWLELQH
jgi:thioredoxin reductase (NADPH)